MSQLKILIADDHAAVRKGINSAFSASSIYTIAGEARDGLEAIRETLSVKPDIVIVDINMPELDGIEVCKRITREIPGIKVIILSMHKDPQYLANAFRAGAMAYVLKTGDPDEIVAAADRVREGLRYLSPALMKEMRKSLDELLSELDGGFGEGENGFHDGA